MASTNLKSLIVVMAFAASVARAQQKPVYPDSEAAKHVGEEATVTGKVFSISTSGKGHTFINLGDRFPKHTFGAIIFAGDSGTVGDVKRYDGKEVAITGRIDTAPDQKPQIVIKSADQIALADASPKPAAPPAATTPAPAPPTAPAPATAASAPMPATAQPAPAPKTGPKAEPEKAEESGKRSGKIELPSGWNSTRRGGDMTRMDLARLFGTAGTASDTTTVDTSIEVYPGVPFLTSLSIAKKSLNLDGERAKTTKVSTPGFPIDSFSATMFTGVFPGGYSRLYLLTDTNEQVVSALLVDSSSRSRVPNEADTDGYHVYNFITGGAKAAGALRIQHKLAQSKEVKGLYVVDTLLVDPTDPEDNTTRFTKGSRTNSKPKTGKVLERSRWYIPGPVVNLILRCVGN